MNRSPWSSFPFVRIILSFIGGLLAAHYENGSICIVGSLFGLLLLLYIFFIWRTPRTAFYVWRSLLGLLALGCIFLLGYLRWLTHEVCHDPKHLTHWSSSIEAYEAVALEDAHEKLARNSVIVATCRGRVQGQWQQIKGKIQIFWPKHTALKIRYGDVLLIKGSPWGVRATSNPYAFDYSAFLSFSQIYHQQFTEGEDIVVIAHRSPNPIKTLSFHVLRCCKSLITQRIHHEKVRAVVLALVLGQKDALTTEVSTVYAHAGTMHVLAISGLHVGIVYWVLRVLLAPLRHMRYFRFLTSLVALVSMWFYAFVTGLSPSVLRATTMLTFIAMAPVLSKQASSYNALAASAFLLLFWDPMLLFAVGFQLSYLAVLGILYLQPRIYKLLSLSNWVLDKLWLLSSVSLGAQIATAPLSMYYFHQFPTYFVIANWVVVPAALAILCLGLLVMVTSFWPSLGIHMAWLLETVVLGVHTFLERIQKLPYNLIDSIYISTSGLFLLYGLLILYLTFLHNKRMPYLIASSLLTMLLTLHEIHLFLQRQSQCKVIFYSIDHHQVISFIKGRHSIICIDKHFKVDSSKYVYHVQPSQAALDITSSDVYIIKEAAQRQEIPMQLWHGLKVIVWQGKKLALLDQEAKNLPRLREKIFIDFLIIEENAVTTLQPLLGLFDFDTLVIGASNQRYLAQQLQEEAKRRNFNSYSLLQQGALTVSW